MELFIQMGHNTRKLAMEHLEDFGSGTVILSPMNVQMRFIERMVQFLLILSCIIREKFRKNYLSMRFGHKMILLHWNPDTLIR